MRMHTQIELDLHSDNRKEDVFCLLSLEDIVHMTSDLCATCDLLPPINYDILQILLLAASMLQSMGSGWYYPSRLCRCTAL